MMTGKGFARLFTRLAPGNRTAAERRLRLEPLEARLVLSVASGVGLPADAAVAHCALELGAMPESRAVDVFPLQGGESPARESGGSCVVTNLLDSGVGSLRWAIGQAADGGVVTFDQSLNGQAIALSSELSISKSVTVDGSSLSDGVSVSGGGACSVFRVTGEGTCASLVSLAVVDGHGELGGGIVVEEGGALSLTGCTVSGNPAPVGGRFTPKAVRCRFPAARCPAIPQNSAVGRFAPE